MMFEWHLNYFKCPLEHTTYRVLIVQLTTNLSSVGYDSALRTLRAFQPAIEIALNVHPNMTTISSVALTHQMKKTLKPDNSILTAMDQQQFIIAILSKMYCKHFMYISTSCFYGKPDNV